MRRLLGLLLITLFAAAACSDDTSGPDATVEGTYTLRTINGVPMPFLFGTDETGAQVHYFSSEMTLFQSGAFREVDVFRFTAASETTFETDTISGVWERNNSNVTLSIVADGETQTLSGVWNGDETITFTDGGFVFVFRKE